MIRQWLNSIRAYFAWDYVLCTATHEAQINLMTGAYRHRWVNHTQHGCECGPWRPGLPFWAGSYSVEETGEILFGKDWANGAAARLAQQSSNDR
jgi:hypothetical protein